MKASRELLRFATLGYDALISGSIYLQALLLLAFRVHWGWEFYLTGRGKLLNHADVVDFFTSLAIPFPGLNAWFVGGLECFGGILLLLGLASRPVALLLTCNMLVAYLSVSADRAKLLGIFSDVDAFLAAEPFYFLLASLLVLCFGPGMISLDALFKKIFRRAMPSEHTCVACEASLPL